VAKTVRTQRGEGQNLQSGTRWWLMKGQAKVADGVFAWLDRLRTRQRAENFRDLLFEAIYTGRPLGLDSDYPYVYTRQSKGAPARLNVVESVVDTVASKLSRRRPMPVISADDAGWGERLFAKRASRIIRRKIGGEALERMFPEVVTDTCVRGTGAIKVYSEEGDVFAERIPRYECIVDPREAKYGKPKTLVHTKAVACDVLCSQFPKYEDAIRKASRMRVDDWQPFDYDSPVESDMVQVAEAWRLPIGDYPGRHVIVIRGQVLYDEEWTRKRFPIIFGRWKKMPRGMWGKGLVEILAGLQSFIDSEFKDIQEAFYWASGLITFTPRGSAIVKHHLVARGPKVVEHEGAIPQYIAPTVVSPQRLQFFWSIVERAYEIAGVSQLSASSKNPLGSNASGKAIDTMYDIESDRFSDQELEIEWTRLEVGRAILDEARALAMTKDDDKDADNDLAPWIKEIGTASAWKKFDIDGGKYHLIMEAENFVPDSRGGRLSTVGELGKAGLEGDQTKLLSEFDEPDLQKYFRDKLAPYNACCAVLEQVGNVEEDMPYVDPQFAPYDQLLHECKNEYMDAKSRNAPEDVLQRYRDYLQLIVAEQQKAAPAPMPGGPMPGMGAPPGQPPGPLPMTQQLIPGPQGPQGAPGLPTPNPLMPQGLA